MELEAITYIIISIAHTTSNFSNIPFNVARLLFTFSEIDFLRVGIDDIALPWLVRAHGP